MYTIRCLFVALLVALASANQPEMRREANANCQCSNPGDLHIWGVAWFGGCRAGYVGCGNELNRVIFTTCCKPL